MVLNIKDIILYRIKKKVSQRRLKRFYAKNDTMLTRIASISIQIDTNNNKSKRININTEIQVIIKSFGNQGVTIMAIC